MKETQKEKNTTCPTCGHCSMSKGKKSAFAIGGTGVVLISLACVLWFAIAFGAVIQSIRPFQENLAFAVYADELGLPEMSKLTYEQLILEGEQDDSDRLAVAALLAEHHLKENDYQEVIYLYNTLKDEVNLKKDGSQAPTPNFIQKAFEEVFPLRLYGAPIRRGSFAPMFLINVAEAFQKDGKVFKSRELYEDSIELSKFYRSPAIIQSLILSKYSHNLLTKAPVNKEKGTDTLCRALDTLLKDKLKTTGFSKFFIKKSGKEMALKQLKKYSIKEQAQLKIKLQELLNHFDIEIKDSKILARYPEVIAFLKAKPVINEQDPSISGDLHEKFAAAVTERLLCQDPETYIEKTNQLMHEDLTPALLGKLREHGILPRSVTELKALKLDLERKQSNKRVKIERVVNIGSTEFGSTKVQVDARLVDNNTAEIHPSQMNSFVFVVKTDKGTGRLIVEDIQEIVASHAKDH